MIAAAGSVAEDGVAGAGARTCRAHCPACGEETEAEEQVLACSSCGSIDVELTAGDELMLESIEYVERGELTVCLGIPGQIVELLDGDEQLARVEVTGVRRTINVGLLDDGEIGVGDWVLIHVGFAMSKIDEEEAAMALSSLRMMGQGYDDELDALLASRVEARERVGRMKFVDEYHDPAAARALVARITDLAGDDTFKFMEVCGGHTHTIYRHGIEHVLPSNVELVHGPGCPVCVIPMGRVDDAIAVAETPGVIFTSFGDMMRVPGGHGNLLEAKARGADVRFVYSPLDALRIAVENPDREVVFFAVGFETTAPRLRSRC